MNFQDDTSNDPDWKVTKSKSDQGAAVSREATKPKYSQKFCEKWLNLFSPWLARCDDDPNKPFCRACQSRLDCNRCHLQRHERTSKHKRNLEILVNKGEGAARQNLSIRQERSKYYQQRKRFNPNPESQDDSEIGMDDDYIDEADQDNEADFSFEQTVGHTSEEQYTQEDSMGTNEIITADLVEHVISTKPGPRNNGGRPRKAVKTELEDVMTEAEGADHKEGMKLLMQIQKDRSELMESFKELMGANVPSTTTSSKEKNHVDLFFESVSSSVKALSPKLIAETKMRVSQLICELELRALTENDGNQHPQAATMSSVLRSSETNPGSYIINQATGQEVHYEALNN